MRKPDERLGVVAISCARRIGERIRDAVINTGEAGRIQVAEPGGLHGGRALGHRGELQRARVAAQVDEDVDRVAGDRCGEFFRWLPRHRTPDVGSCRDLPGIAVRRVGGRVAKDLARCALVPLEHRQHEKRHDVVAEVAR